LVDKKLVSIIIPTYNSGHTLEKCLSSIKNQTYNFIEILIIDNCSIDNTKNIALKYGAKVIEVKAERSESRNIGLKKSNGKFLLFIDSDMELTIDVVGECIEKILNSEKTGGIIIPEKSVGDSYWVKVRNFERSFYHGTVIESARFFKRKEVLEAGGYDEDIIFFEESTLPQKIEKLGYNVSLRINSEILHHEEDFNLFKWLKKKKYYAHTKVKYSEKYKKYSSFQANIFYRYYVFIKNDNWKQFLSKPFLAFSVLLLKTLEIISSGLGYISTGKETNINEK
jgi:glycosyltransferase involved in cell wall biosynthesis